MALPVVVLVLIAVFVATDPIEKESVNPASRALAVLLIEPAFTLTVTFPWLL